MTSPLILSVGMPRAGSGWHYNLIHDLVIATGGQNARTVRNKFFLQPVLTEVNCNIGAFTAKRLLPVLLPTFLGQKYVIKAHAGPSAMALNLIKKKRILAAYIYRDPRDALLSAYEYGQRKRQKVRLGAFSNLLTLDDAIDFMVE